MFERLEPRDGRKARRMPVSRKPTVSQAAPVPRPVPVPEPAPVPELAPVPRPAPVSEPAPVPRVVPVSLSDLVPVPAEPGLGPNIAIPAKDPLLEIIAAVRRSRLRGVAVAIFAVAMFGLMFQSTPGGAATAIDDEYLLEHAVVVASDRLVCSLAGGQQEIAGIQGQDGSHSVAVDGIVYWNFGDTVLANGAMIPNNIAWSADTDAADCISLVPKSAGKRAASLLSKAGSELTVWPGGMEATSPGTVHFFYASIVGTGLDDWRVAGVGLASFDTKTLTSERAFDGELPWPVGLPQPIRTIADGGYVYVLLGTAQENWSTDTILARVPSDEIESLGAYEYWQPPAGADAGHWVAGLWDPDRGAWQPALNQIDALWSQPGLHNGVQVSYNEFLDSWLAVYSAGFMSSISVRSAPELTGPWDGPEATLIDCQAHHPPPSDSLLCYTGAQQDAYTEDGGRTIYVSYSNGDDYNIYLHEIRFASPVVEWTDRLGRTVYVPAGTEGPAEFHEEAPAFYASDIPVNGFLPIHRWVDEMTGAVRYGALAPGESYQDLGIDFYAPVEQATAEAANALYAPVYRWSNEGQTRYAALNLAERGWELHEVAFFAACPDSDSDALSDCEESYLGTDPLLADTDGDGLHDGYELSMAGCNPLVYNDDRDGTSSAEELLLGLNPCVWGPGTRDV